MKIIINISNEQLERYAKKHHLSPDEIKAEIILTGAEINNDFNGIDIVIDALTNEQRITNYTMAKDRTVEIVT